MNVNWKHRQLNSTGKCDDKTCDYCYPKTKPLTESKFNWWPSLPKIRKIKRKEIK